MTDKRTDSAFRQGKGIRLVDENIEMHKLSENARQVRQGLDLESSPQLLANRPI
jgi:hypothetical protein